MDDVRKALSTVLEQTAISIPLNEKRYGIHVGSVADKSLFEHASFVLAVSAEMPNETLRNDFPNRVKIGSVEQISELVNVQLQGIKINPLPVAPRQIPFHAGSVYFELEKGGEYWDKLKLSGAIALHLSGDFPGVSMEFWAIKGG
jgi:type VI secretion system protein ImpJ